MSRRVQAAIDHIPHVPDRDQIHRRLIEEAVTSPDGADVDRNPERYVSRVVDRLGFVQSPLVDCVFVSEEKREALREKQLAGVDDLSKSLYEDMDRPEKVDYLRRRLCARAENSPRGSASVTYGDVRDGFFNGHPSDSHVYDLMEEAADGTDEFRYGLRRGTKRLATNHRWWTSPSESEPADGDEYNPKSDPEAIAAAFGPEREGTLSRAAETVRRNNILGEERHYRSFLANAAGEGVLVDDVPDDAVNDLRERLESESASGSDGSVSLFDDAPANQSEWSIESPEVADD